MAVEVDSKEGQIIRKLIPLATLPAAPFSALCADITIEEIEDQALFNRGDTDTHLVYLISGEVVLQAEGLIVEVINATSESARFALAHQIPRKIDAVANGLVRFVRLDADVVNNPPPLIYKEDKSYMVIEESEDGSDDWMTALLKTPIFQRLPPANLQKILISLNGVCYKQGEVIVEQGGKGDYYYLIKSGECQVSRKPTPSAKEIKLAKLGKGDTFGEDALLSDFPRNVTITALTDAVLMQLDKEQFVKLIKEPSLKFVDYNEMQLAIKHGANLLDVRSQDDYEVRHLKNSTNVPFFSLRVYIKSLNREKPVIVVCGDGKISEAAAFLLLRNKFDAMILKGGMASVAPDPKHESALFKIDDGHETLIGTEKILVDKTKNYDKRSESIDYNPNLIDRDALEEQVKILKSENEQLRRINQHLQEKYTKLKNEKQQLEKLIQSK
ncbi:MAG: cyclic nucleotide-binding domain-containing protein [Methylococcaceae bacterium]|nr:cyclic nucleotide-binding domain-containing protein [Methylococcaceae bacterium]